MGRYRRSGWGFLPVMALLAVTGCASSNPPKLATCNGKYLRDVNFHGTVLPGGVREPQPDAAGEAPPPPPEIGARRQEDKDTLLASSRSCRGLG